MSNFFFVSPSMKRIYDGNTNVTKFSFSHKGIKTRYTATHSMDKAPLTKNFPVQALDIKRLYCPANKYLWAFQNLILTWQYKHDHILKHFLHFENTAFTLKGVKPQITSRLLQKLSIQKSGQDIHLIC